MAVNMSMLSWVVTPCGFVGSYQDGDGRFLRNVGYLHVALQARTKKSTLTLPSFETVRMS
jgi:hypothetical protein